MNERDTIDRGWFYVIEPDGGRWAPEDQRIVADDGQVLTRRLHGHPGRVEVVDQTGTEPVVATWLRAAGAVGRAMEARGWSGRHGLVVLEASGTPTSVDVAPDGRLRITLDGALVASAPSHHPVEALVAGALASSGPPADPTPPGGALPDRPTPRAMFFESLMNTDMPHNDKDLSQGVLHIVSALDHLDTEVVLVNAKMSITGTKRGVQGLDNLHEALAGGPVHLIGITLLEGYWEGVVHLIETIRGLGCRAHIAVGGVMPTLACEHTAAHLPEVSFVCRGAGEYFTPALASILGPNGVDTPLSAAQRHALLAMDGMIVVDRAGGRLLSCRSDQTITVDNLDRVPLNLDYLQARHMEGGIELATSRGCIHKCSFCSILGRESYQARSAGSVFEMLEAYQCRFEALFGDRIPHNSYRVHFSDDDFACDKARAAEVFRGILATPFRLSSVQVAVGDLCRREGGRLLAEPDPEILDAIRPECFADHARPIPKVDFYEDHKSRDWSSFLQIGVETYSDREIARLGKGYKRVHVRTIVAELSRRGLHMDGYFILSNADTTAEDMVEVFTEVARLKLRFPEHFHMRFPVVQHLVSYFTAASHRRHVRRGRRHVMKLRGHAQVPGHPELDYPFVDHDEPMDAWVRDTVAHTFVTDEGLYTENLAVLGAMWKPRYKALDADDPQRRRVGRLLRALDDRPRRVVFEMLRHAWLGEDEGWPCAQLDKQVCLDTAERVLGPQQGWMHLLRHVVRAEPERRLVVASSLPEEAREDAIDLLWASEQEDVALHLVGDGDDLSDWLARLAVTATRARAGQARWIVDGRLVRPDLVASLVSLGAEVQWDVTPDAVALPGIAQVRAAGLGARVVLQVRPDQVDQVVDAVRAVAAAGASDLVFEPVARWDASDAKRWGAALFALGTLLRTHTELSLATLIPGREQGPGAGCVAVSPEGDITRADCLTSGEAIGRTERLARLDQLTNVDRHALDLAEPDRFRRVGTAEQHSKDVAPAMQVLRSFVGWLRSESPGTGTQAGQARP